jgi:hypothetical protein
VTIHDLPEGYQIKAEELNVDSDHYSTAVQVDGGTASTATSATISSAGSSQHRHSITFTNTSEKKRLSLTKEVTGNANDQAQKFLFSVTLYSVEKGGETSAIPSFSVANNMSFDTTFGVEPLTASDIHVAKSSSQIVVWFYLKSGQTVYFENLPSNTQYVIEEPETALAGNSSVKQNEDLAYYTTSAVYMDTTEGVTSKNLSASHRKIVSAITDEGNDVVFTNARTDTLTLKKVITSRVASASTFTFDLTLKRADGTFLPDGTYGDVTIQNGKATISLKGGESKTLTGLPSGTKYTVVETNASKYITSIEVLADKSQIDETTRTAGGTVYGGTVVIYTNDETEKTIIPDTGLRIEGTPFLILTAFAIGLGLLLMISKRKTRKEM